MEEPERAPLRQCLVGAGGIGLRALCDQCDDGVHLGIDTLDLVQMGRECFAGG
jgi:hypothetical protein